MNTRDNDDGGADADAKEFLELVRSAARMTGLPPREALRILIRAEKHQTIFVEDEQTKKLVPQDRKRDWSYIPTGKVDRGFFL